MRLRDFANLWMSLITTNDREWSYATNQLFLLNKQKQKHMYVQCILPPTIAFHSLHRTQKANLKLNQKQLVHVIELKRKPKNLLQRLHLSPCRSNTNHILQSMPLFNGIVRSIEHHLRPLLLIYQH